MATTNNNVGFRLDDYFLQLLVTQAEGTGVSIHEQARSLVKKALDGDGGITEVKDQTRALVEQATQTDSRLEALEGQVSEMRKELAVAVEALLIAAGKLEADEARRWTKENLGT